MGEITFSGLASGMDTSQWVEALVAIKQKSVTTLQNKQTNITSTKTVLDALKSNMTALRSSIEKLTDAKLGGSFDLFSKNTVTSSNESVVTATANENAARQSLDVVVKQLASSTVATSTYDSKINENTEFSKLSSGNAKSGSLSLYVDGEKKEITVEETDTVGDILDKIVDAGGQTRTGNPWNGYQYSDNISAEIKDGKISITANNGKEIVLGSTTDESNFTSVMGLVRDSSTGNYASSTSVSAVGTSDKIVDVFGKDAKGTFTIGNQEFTVDENTTFKSLINNINSKTDAGVNASWDSTNGTLVLKAKTEGAFNINIEAGSSNLTNDLGFTSATTDRLGNVQKDAYGNYISKVVQSTQTLGDYAKFTVNGNEMTSSSNTVTSDISGIDGLTLKLNAVSKPNENGEVESSNISVSQDSQGVLDAVKSFIESYNKTISTIDEKTAYGESLYGETSLTSIRNNLRKTATAEASDTSLKILANIGITTGKAGNSTDTSGVNKLQIDEKKFLEALQNDPEGVKELLLGDNKGNDNSGGVLNKLEKITEDSLASTTGYFDAKTKSYDRQLSNLKTSISNAQLKVDSYKARLEKQFKNMESIISSIQNSYSQLSI